MSDTQGMPPLRPGELFRVLNDHEVEFVVIGGMAMLAHNATRATKDLDIVPDPDPRNLDRLWAALTSLDASPLELRDFNDNEVPLPWERASLDFGGNWLLRTNLGRVDVLQYVSGIDGFNSLRENAIDIINSSAGRIWFAGRDDLISMKRAAGRPQDLLDIERIERDGDDPLTGF